MCSNAAVLRGFLLVLTGVAVACSLSVDDKTGCRTSADCVGTRICQDEQCTPGACEATCARACAGLDACSLAGAEDCPSRCTTDEGILPGFGEAQCKRQWDLLDTEDCQADACRLYCRDLCAVAQGCALIDDDDGVACMLECQVQSEPCAGPAPAACVEIPGDVRCYVESC